MTNTIKKKFLSEMTKPGSIDFENRTRTTSDFFLERSSIFIDDSHERLSLSLNYKD